MENSSDRKNKARAKKEEKNRGREKKKNDM